MKKFEFKGLKFLFFIIILSLAIAVFDSQNIYAIINTIYTMLLKLLPIFALVIVITTLINYFLKPKKIMKYFGANSGKKGLFFAIVGGIISHGPMYAWYPMLDDMRKHGLKFGLIATFMYARAVKLPLLPLMVALFGLPFTIIVNIYILIFAIIQGKIIDKL